MAEKLLRVAHRLERWCLKDDAFVMLNVRCRSSTGHGGGVNQPLKTIRAAKVASHGQQRHHF
jgi:hypothetical protein